jgi:hypothetical protein
VLLLVSVVVASSVAGNCEKTYWCCVTPAKPSMMMAAISITATIFIPISQDESVYDCGIWIRSD